MGIFVCAKGSVASALNYNLVVVNKSNGKLLRKVSCEVSRLVVGKTVIGSTSFATMFSGLPPFEHTYMHNIHVYSVCS